MLPAREGQSRGDHSPGPRRAGEQRSHISRRRGPPPACGRGGQAPPEPEEPSVLSPVAFTGEPDSLAGGLYSLIGSLPPIGVTSLEDTNLNLPLQSGDVVLYWDAVHNQYLTYTYGAPGQWLEPDQSTIGPAPALNVAQGFFYNPGVTEHWTQNLNVQ